MARSARDARHQAARLGLLVATLGLACAVMEQPPGGPPDFAAPVILSITPDSGAIVPGFDDPVVIRFDEVISEQSGGGLERLVELSPRVEQVKVSWKRTAMRIEPKGGWRPDVVYQLALLPGVADLRNNRMDSGRTVVFSTGGAIPDTRLQGTVIDWEEGRAAPGALIEAALLPDSLVYATRADSVGDFRLAAIPVGTYLVTAAVDRNTNRRREPREPFASATLALDSTADAVFWTFVQDTVGPALREAVPIDSTTLRLQFTQKLDPTPPESTAARVWVLPDTIPVPVRFVWTEAVYDSVRAAERAAADSAAAADTTKAEAVDTAGALPPRPPVAERQADSVPARDTSRAARLLPERPVLRDTWYLRLPAPLTPGGRYLVEASARNVAGALRASRTVAAIPAPPDST